MMLVIVLANLQQAGYKYKLEKRKFKADPGTQVGDVEE